MTPEQRREAIRERAGEVQARAVQIRSQGPSCLYCRHGPEKSAKGVCEHPIFWEMNGEPVAGIFSSRSHMGTIKARSEEGLCGPEAELFEPRNAFSRVWRALRPYLWP